MSRVQVPRGRMSAVEMHRLRDGEALHGREHAATEGRRVHLEEAVERCRICGAVTIT